MNFNKIKQQLQSISLFELYYLQNLINEQLQDQEAINQIRKYLQLNQNINYHDIKFNQLKSAKIIELKKKTLIIEDFSDNKIYQIPYHIINLTNEFFSTTSNNDYQKSDFFVDQIVNFKDKKGQDLYGKIIKLNPKTATLITSNNMRWRVSYNLLSKVIDSDLDCQKLTSKLNQLED